MRLEDMFQQEKEESNRTVVRVTTSSWYDGNALHQRRSIRTLKRKSTGFNGLDEDCRNVDVDAVIGNINNFNEVPDGIYNVVVCNTTRDYETGWVDRWEYELVPYEEEN